MREFSNSYINFKITSAQIISKEFLKRNIFDFNAALSFIRHLPYGRNADKKNLETVFTDECGTCSTKHALLKRLAIENSISEVRLFVGLFRMNAENTPQIESTLKKANLDYIPEAHCFLKINEDRIDVTKSNSKPDDFVTDLTDEIEILPEYISEYKNEYHKTYLQNWLIANQEIKLSLDELWEIREQCIGDLEGGKNKMG
ncbi:MAG: hypothetical protein ABI851_06245 [Saprospiraceae bacterium]